MKNLLYVISTILFGAPFFPTHALNYKIDIINNSSHNLQFNSDGDFWFHQEMFKNKVVPANSSATFTGFDKGSWRPPFSTDSPDENILYVQARAKSSSSLVSFQSGDFWGARSTNGFRVFTGRYDHWDGRRYLNSLIETYKEGYILAAKSFWGTDSDSVAFVFSCNDDDKDSVVCTIYE